ncbi:BrnT family toxin [Azospirillum sp. SYSU D00513]|uniref:BrnT family toxin n=1 Tax=Azospirillum sp. SYSU D00513 TaxID=2812561 RepID=UPI001A9611C6
MFCWDEAKYQSNVEKHKVSFDLASLIFDGLTVEWEDTRFAYGEVRINAFGYLNSRLFTCTYAPRYGWRHVISLRKANAKEVRIYG